MGGNGTRVFCKLQQSKSLCEQCSDGFTPLTFKQEPPPPSLFNPQEKGWLCLENNSPWPFVPQFGLRMRLEPRPLHQIRHCMQS